MHGLLILLFLAALAPTTANARDNSVRAEIPAHGFKLILDATPIANLTFQLDCLANLIHCDENAISPLWKTHDWTPEDDGAVREWGELQEKYSGFEVALPELPKKELREIGYPLRHRGVTFDQRFRIIGFTAASLEEYRKGVGILMRAEDADRALAILRRFEPRFSHWWNETGSKTSESFVGSFASLMKKAGITAILERSVPFYKAQLPGSAEIYIHFIPLPSASGHTSGEQIENHGVVELLASEKPEDRIDVICHEVFHYFYSLASTRDHSSLVSYFVNSRAPYGIPAYNLLNEALATAFGNGMVARAVHSPDWFAQELARKKSFYNDYAIDAVAKSILPELDRIFGKQEPLYDPAFLGLYLTAVGNALGDESAAPQLFLRTAAVFYENEFRAEYRDFQRKIHSGSTWDNTDPESDFAQGKLKASPKLSGLVLLRPESARLLEHWAPLIPAAAIREMQRAAKRKSFVYAAERATNAWIFVLVAPAGEQAGKLLSKLAEAKAPFKGFLP